MSEQEGGQGRWSAPSYRDQCGRLRWRPVSKAQVRGAVEEGVTVLLESTGGEAVYGCELGALTVEEFVNKQLPRSVDTR